MPRRFKLKTWFGLAAVVAGILWDATARAQGTVPGQTMVPLGYCQVLAAGLASAVKLSAACSGGIPTGATMVYLQAETANVRYRDDGTAPTGSAGNLLVSGSQGILYTGPVGNLQFIIGSAGAILDVGFYRQ